MAESDNRRISRILGGWRWTLFVGLMPVLAAHASPLPPDADGPAARQMQEGHYHTALKILHAKLRSESHDAHLQALQGRAQLALGQAEAAVASFRRAAKLDPHNGRYQYWLGEALAQRIPEVSVFSKSSLASDLRDAFERAVALEPDFIPAHESLMEFYLRAPGFLGGGMDKALQQSRVIAKLNPARGKRANAIIAMTRDHVDVAMSDYKQAIHLAPHDASLRIELGKLYRKHGHAHEACVVFQQALRLAPNHADALYQLGQAATASRHPADLKAGARALRHLIALSPETVSLAEARQQLRKIESLLVASAATTESAQPS